MRRMSSISLRRQSCLGSASGRSGAGVRRFEDGGEAGLLDRRLGRASGKRVPVDREDEVERLYRMRYNGFTARHFHEHLVRDHGFRWGYTWTKVFLQSKGLLERAPRRGAHRRKRPRRPLPGMMLHQDGSRHAWLSGQEALDLIVTMDDATSAIYSAFLTPEEGTASTFRALAEVLAYTAGHRASIWTVAAIISRPPRPARRWIASGPPRLGGRWRISAWSISRRIRRRPAGGPSGCFRPCRTGW